ncbi:MULTISPECIES: nitroreductase family protein [Campylobacter]|uniref:nitroreductase family protein n=1 Tax=Campylobacter TaxID=194 RepID=UPI0014738076|nr:MULTISPECIES: nitroreductase family protein [unclassified Campylobacter]MBE3610018.1 nitroreductase family protein [Campylobacter sp. RM12916]
MQLLEAMQKRKSVREFNRYVPTKEEIEAVIDAGCLSPTLFTTKDAHISVITDKELLHELDAAAVKKFGGALDMMGVKNTLYDAPVYILLSGKLVEKMPQGWEFLKPENMHRNVYWAMGSVMQNMQLRATELGLSSCLVNTVVVTLFDEPELAKKAGIPDGYSPLCSIVLGKSDKNSDEPRAPNRSHYGISYI